MRVKIAIPRAMVGEFSKVKLSFENSAGVDVEVSLNIDFRNIYKFTKEKTGVGVDLFLIGCIVYGIDVLLSREDFSANGWAREIEVEFPVESPDLFALGKKELEELLSFLTGDYWGISFSQRDVSKPLYRTKPRDKVHSEGYRKSHKKVSLFSGGLDSLVGVIDQLTKSEDRIIFVSHYDANFTGAKSDQDKIHKVLSKKHKHYHLLQTRVDLSTYDNGGNKIKNETTLRSRSFLFLCQAIMIARSINEGIEVLIPENGTISLNHPLTPSRSSSCSTRTAHPYYLMKVFKFISNLELIHPIINDYELHTKGEMLVGCLDKEVLLATYDKSCSCAKRGTRKDIRDITTGTNHCGICMPCIYRRVALFSIHKDNEVVGTNIFSPTKFPLEKLPDVPAFIDYMQKEILIEDIERNLLVNGSLDLDKIGQYADVVDRSRREIVNWIRAQGETELKKKTKVK